MLCIVINSILMDKVIAHKYFKYFKFIGLSIILFKCIKTGTALFGYVGFVGTEQEWRFTLVFISFILKLSLFVSILLAFILHHIYENGKMNGHIFNES